MEIEEEEGLPPGKYLWRLSQFIGFLCKELPSDQVEAMAKKVSDANSCSNPSGWQLGWEKSMAERILTANKFS